VKLHPNTILALRKAQGLRAKTDRIDAMLIARYLADAVRRADLPATFRADERQRALAARRRRLVDARQAECCRADLANDPIVRESLATVVAALTQSLDAIEEAIERHIASDGELDRLAKALRAVRGVGPVVAATLVADLPELGRLTGKQIAALVGLAPPILTKAEKRAGRPKPAMEDRSCAARCSTPPGPLSAILPQCGTSTIAWSKPIIAPEKSP
jgi:transposase